MPFHQVNEEEIQRQHTIKNKKENPDERVRLFLLKEGITQLRILPPFSDKGVWFYEVKEHAAKENVFYSPQACPKQFDPSADCPFCEQEASLRNLGGEDNVAASREFRARSAYYYNALVYSAPSDPEFGLGNGIQILKSGVKVLRELLDLDQDASGGWGDLTNLEKGIDVRITRRGTGQYGTEYSVKGVPQRTNIIEKLKEKGFELGEPHDLEVILGTAKSYDDLKAVMESDSSFENVFEGMDNGGAPPLPS